MLATETGKDDLGDQIKQYSTKLTFNVNISTEENMPSNIVTGDYDYEVTRPAFIQKDSKTLQIYHSERFDLGGAE